MTFVVKGLENTRRVFNSKKRRLDNLRPLQQEVAIYAERRAKESFQRQADPVTGRKWKRLKRATILARRRRRGGNGNEQKLLDTGTLRNRTVGRVDGRNRAVVVNPMVYANVHQFGYAPRNIPQRRYAGLSRKDLKLLGKMMGRYVSE